MSAILGFFSIVQSLAWLIIGFAILQNSDLASSAGLDNQQQLQTMVFLQLIVGGHLLILVTRSERWFFLRPFPAWQLFGAIVATQIVAVLICGFGWFVPALSIAMIALTWAYNLVWMLVLGAVRVPTERWLDGRTANRAKHTELIHRRLYAS